MEYQPRCILPTNTPAMVRAYLEAAEWADVSEARSCGRSPFSCENLCDPECPPSDQELFEAMDHPTWDSKSYENAIADCLEFVQRVKALLSDHPLELEVMLRLDEQMGHDLWLSRCGHGAGFFDRDCWTPFQDQLQAEARNMGERWVSASETDDLLYID